MHRRCEKSELLRVEEEHVGCKAAEALQQERDFKEQLCLALAARELHRRDRLLRDRKPRLARVASRSIGNPGVP
jgi:hypothetical protein